MEWNWANRTVSQEATISQTTLIQNQRVRQRVRDWGKESEVSPGAEKLWPELCLGTHPDIQSNKSSPILILKALKIEQNVLMVLLSVQAGLLPTVPFTGGHLDVPQRGCPGNVTRQAQEPKPLGTYDVWKTCQMAGP